MSLSTSEGFAELGMWHDAWEVLQSLAPEDKLSAAALRLRLRCCAALGAWGLGEQLANLLSKGGTLERHSAATFHHANARRLLAAGDKAGAEAAVKAAVDAWPDYHLAIVLDPLLGELSEDRE